MQDLKFYPNFFHQLENRARTNCKGRFPTLNGTRLVVDRGKTSLENSYVRPVYGLRKSRSKETLISISSRDYDVRLIEKLEELLRSVNQTFLFAWRNSVPATDALLILDSICRLCEPEIAREAVNSVYRGWTKLNCGGNSYRHLVYSAFDPNVTAAAVREAYRMFLGEEKTRQVCAEYRGCKSKYVFAARLLPEDPDFGWMASAKTLYSFFFFHSLFYIDGAWNEFLPFPQEEKEKELSETLTRFLYEEDCYDF